MIHIFYSCRSAAGAARTRDQRFAKLCSSHCQCTKTTCLKPCFNIFCWCQMNEGNKAPLFNAIYMVSWPSISRMRIFAVFCQNSTVFSDSIASSFQSWQAKTTPVLAVLQQSKYCSKHIVFNFLFIFWPMVNPGKIDIFVWPLLTKMHVNRTFLISALSRHKFWRAQLQSTTPFWRSFLVPHPFDPFCT